MVSEAGRGQRKERQLGPRQGPAFKDQPSSTRAPARACSPPTKDVVLNPFQAVGQLEVHGNGGTPGHRGVSGGVARTGKQAPDHTWRSATCR